MGYPNQNSRRIPVDFVNLRLILLEDVNHD